MSLTLAIISSLPGVRRLRHFRRHSRMEFLPMTVQHRKVKHISHAVGPDGQIDRKAVAAELRHVADLFENGLLELRNPSESPLPDGWDRLVVERKQDPRLTA